MPQSTRESGLPHARSGEPQTCVGRIEGGVAQTLGTKPPAPKVTHPSFTHREAASVLTETAGKPKQQPGFWTGLEWGEGVDEAASRLGRTSQHGPQDR